jgi:hypothetical protein
MSFLTHWRSDQAMDSSGESAARFELVPSVLEVREWRDLLIACPNVLVEGHESALAATVLSLMPELRHPIYAWREGALLFLPVERRGTLILHDVATLPCEQQTMLLRWLRASGERMQIVSTTSTPLFSLVERGAFIADLYYYLNAVRLEVGLPSDAR